MSLIHPGLVEVGLGLIGNIAQSFRLLKSSPKWVSFSVICSWEGKKQPPDPLLPNHASQTHLAGLYAIWNWLKGMLFKSQFSSSIWMILSVNKITADENLIMFNFHGYIQYIWLYGPGREHLISPECITSVLFRHSKKLSNNHHLVHPVAWVEAGLPVCLNSGRWAVFRETCLETI